MEKTRVNKGEKYWSIDKYGSIQEYLECGSVLNDYHYESLLYFHTEEETRAMRDKLCAVLKGADVIEMPSEKECEEESNKQRQNYNPMPDEADYVGGFGDAIEFLRSKIVK